MLPFESETHDGNTRFSPELSLGSVLVSRGFPWTKFAAVGAVYESNQPLGFDTSIRNSAPVMPFAVAPPVFAMTYKVVPVYGGTDAQACVPAESR
jgi:hypothetical protein